MYLKRINKFNKTTMTPIYGFTEVEKGINVKFISKERIFTLPIPGETIEIWDGGQKHFESIGSNMTKNDYYLLFEKIYKDVPKKATYTRKDGTHETKDFKEWYELEVGGDKQK